DSSTTGEPISTAELVHEVTVVPPAASDGAPTESPVANATIAAVRATAATTPIAVRIRPPGIRAGPAGGARSASRGQVPASCTWTPVTALTATFCAAKDTDCVAPVVWVAVAVAGETGPVRTTVRFVLLQPAVSPESSTVLTSKRASVAS